jgi:tRNA-dihydrouridine synthase
VVERMRGSHVGGVLVGRGALRNPWIFQQAADLAAGRAPREISMQERGQFLLDYIEMLQQERLHEEKGFRHVAPGTAASALHAAAHGPARGHDRWVINKLRALNSWYTKGIDNGSHLRVAINAADSIPRLRAIVENFFFAPTLSARS